MSTITRMRRKGAATAALVVIGLTAAAVVHPGAAQAATTYPYTLSSNQLNVGFGSDGSIQSLRVANDLFDTQYMMNPDVAPDQGNETVAKYKQWFGNLMFSYALGNGTVSQTGVGSNAWKKAWTTESGDGRTVTSDGTSVTVTYANSTNAEGVKNFTVTEKYSLDASGNLVWSQTAKNTSTQNLTIGDWGVPVPTNELWKQGDSIYETRVLSHSYVGKNGSYITAQRPSGQGPGLVISSDDATGSGFEYQDRWRSEEVGDTSWAWNSADEGSNIRGLNTYYVHSAAIAKTNRGYLPNTSLQLTPGQSKTYTFHVAKTTSDDNVKDTLYNQGSLDATVVPGMVVPYDQVAQLALRVKGGITSVVAKNLDDLKGPAPTNPTVTLDRANGAYKIYKIAFNKSQLGNNQVTVNYTGQSGAARSTVLQFDVIDKVSSALDAHAQFMTDKMQWTTNDGIDTSNVRYGTFDDWLMNASDGSVPTSTNGPQGKRNEYAGYFGLGDDWGLTHGQFLAEKNVASPVLSQVKALDTYTEKAVWEHLMGNTINTTSPKYLVYDFWEEGKLGSANTTPSYRGYAYPHIYNTFYSMYKIEKQNPNLITYSHSAEWYLNTAYEIFKELYDGPVAYNYNTGLMGELSTPSLIASLRAEGMNAQANDVASKMATKYTNFKGEKYPYGSEYSYDNTGEEAVYTLAKLNVNADPTNALRMMRDIVMKTRAARGQMPVWYYYSDPTTITGDNWWQSQYSASLAGYTMDDYINHTSALEAGANAVSSSTRAELQRLNYAGKLMNLSNINSGQINNDPRNIGASAWSYSAEKGNLGTLGTGGGANIEMLNGWRGMTGESDLGLWGALHTLSADVVTDDPIFGTVGYGAELTSGSTSTTITPTDGLQRRLNLVTQQLSVDLDNDKYTKATVAKNSADVSLAMTNVSGAAHTGSLSVSGLAQGTYSVLVNGTSQGKVNVYTAPVNAGKLKAPTLVNYSVPAGATYTIRLAATSPNANTAPKVNAGADQAGLQVGLDPITLSGSVTDDNLGSPNGTLTTKWTLTSKPTGATATFSDDSSLYPTLTADTVGTYVFTLTASDGALTGSDTVSVQVDPVQPMPTNWVSYTFNTTTNATTVPDRSGNGNDLTLHGSASTGTDGASTVLKLDGTDGSYAQLPDDIMAGAADTTISTNVKLTTAAPTYSRLFDFGNSSTKYMFLSPNMGNGKLGFAITKAGNGAESQITTDYTVPTGTWINVRLTITKNAGATTSTGTLYVNGTQVGQNTALAVAPKDLGRTANDYIGKSQFPDPYLSASYDDFRINGAVVSSAPKATGVSISGTTTPGSTLTAKGSGDPTDSTLRYQWSRAGTAITGATAKAYTTVAADAGKALTVAVTATKNGYSGTATKSAAVTIATPTIALSATTVPRGNAVTVSGRGFAASSTATITLDTSATSLGTATTDSAGAFTKVITIPSGTTTGTHAVVSTAKSISARAAATIS